MNTDTTLTNLSHLSPLTAFVKQLVATPGASVSIERTGNRRRLRYMVADPKAGKASRKSIELPMDNNLIADMEAIIHDHRNVCKAAKAVEPTPAKDADEWESVLRKRLLAVCPRGRVIRRRVALALDVAIRLGPATLFDYLAHKPWLAKPRPMGRPRKRMPAHGSEDMEWVRTYL